MLISDIKNEVASNLGDSGFTQFTTSAIGESIQDAYNLVAARTLCFEKSILFPQIPNQVYYRFSDYISDMLAISGIFNYATNRWLIPTSIAQLHQMRWDFELMVGEPTYFDPQNFRYTCIVPHNSVISNIGFQVFYKTTANTLDDNTTPNIPPQTVQTLSEYATKDQFESIREFTKASEWKGLAESKLTIIRKQCRQLASADKVSVLSSGFIGSYVFNGLAVSPWKIITGVVDGVNYTFMLAASPNPSTSLLLMKNLQIQTPNVDYFLTGDTIQFVVPPIIGETLRSWYVS